MKRYKVRKQLEDLTFKVYNVPVKKHARDVKTIKRFKYNILTNNIMVVKLFFIDNNEIPF